MKKRRLLPFLFLFFICLFFFHKGIFLNKKTIIWDSAGQFYPALWFSGHFWSRGILPLWNPFLFNGYPAFADPQNQTFYPINILISMLTPFSAKVVYLQLVLHFLLAGVFIYLLSGFYIKSTLGRLTSSIIYMFSGFMINHFQHLTMINSFAWLPLIIFFLENGWRKNKFLYFIPAGVTISFLIFAGHPQTMLYIFFIMFSFSVFACLHSDTQKSFGITPLIIAGVAIIFGLLLGAIQLIPSYEFSTLANRSGKLPYELASGAGQLHPLHLFTLFLSNYFGGGGVAYVGLNDIAHSSIYSGVILLFILPYSFVGRKKETYFFMFMALLTLIIALGNFGYFFKVLYQYFPGFNLFRSPVHYRFGFAFFAALLAGIGLDNMLNKNYPNKYVQFFYLTIIFICIFGIVLFTLSSPIKEKVLHYLWIDVMLFIFLFLFFLILAVLWKKQKISLLIFQGGFLLITFFDFYLHGANSISAGMEMKHRELDRETVTVMKLKNKAEWFIDEKIKTPFLPFGEDEKSFYRVYVNDGYDKHTGLLPQLPYDSVKLCSVGTNKVIFDKFFMVDGYNPMMLKRYVFFNALFRDMNYEKFLMLSNAKYIIEPDGSITLLPREKTLSRAYIVMKADYIADPSAILNKLSEPSFNIKEEALVEEPAGLVNNDACKKPAYAKILNYLPNKIRIQTESECPGLLVLSETHYPGWKVKIDSGAKKDALKVNYCFMGTLIPKGEHNVDFEFEPMSLRIGLIISLIAFLTGGIVFAIALIGKK